VVFNDEMEIIVSNTTIVGRQESKDRFDINAISVGQRIMVFGELDVDETELDATQGYVIMLLTTLKGTVVEVDSNVVISLNAIDGRGMDVFDFLGTGIDPDNDADPANYDIDPADLDTSGLEIGTPVKFRGFVTPFGHPAEQADFEARTMINVSAVKGLMIVNWFPSATDAIQDLSELGFTLNLEGAGPFHHLIRAGVSQDLTQLDNAPIVESEGDGSGLFQIVQDGSRQFFFNFEGFVEELLERLDNDAAVTHIVATGTFDDTNAILASDFVIVGLN
jgi:hypothetical protein